MLSKGEQWLVNATIEYGTIVGTWRLIKLLGDMVRSGDQHAIETGVFISTECKEALLAAIRAAIAAKSG